MSVEPKERNILKLILIVRFTCATLKVGHPIHRSDLGDRPSSSRPPLEDIDARILQVLEAEPGSSVRTITEFLELPAPTVHLHLTTSLNMKS
jgi:hypothetical protein